MSFLTFVLYFFAAHLLYSIVMSFVVSVFGWYQRKRYNKNLKDMLSSGQLQVVQLDGLGEDDKWH